MDLINFSIQIMFLLAETIIENRHEMFKKFIVLLKSHLVSQEKGWKKNTFE